MKLTKGEPFFQVCIFPFGIWDFKSGLTIFRRKEMGLQRERAGESGANFDIFRHLFVGQMSKYCVWTLLCCSNYYLDYILITIFVIMYFLRSKINSSKVLIQSLKISFDNIHRKSYMTKLLFSSPQNYNLSNFRLFKSFVGAMIVIKKKN